MCEDCSSKDRQAPEGAVGVVVATVVDTEITTLVCIASGPLPASLQERESRRRICAHLLLK